MNIFNILKMTLLAFTVTLFSCTKDDGVEINPNNPNKVTLLHSNQWTTVAQHTQPKTQGNLGGSFQTQTFRMQSPTELRWYLWFTHMSGYQDPIEIILNNQNTVAVNKPSGTTGSDFRSIKTIYGADIWETHIPFSNTYAIAVFKNNQNININLSDQRATPIKRLQASEDGLLNNSESTGTNTVSHYHYGSRQWKTNTFFATSYISVRYNDRTFVINLNKNTSQDGIGIYAETDNKVIGSQGQIHYLMKAENHLALSPVGFMLHSTQYGDHVFVAIDAYGNKFEVYKINLSNYTIQKVLDETKVGTYSQYANEIDANGNLYCVENRIENQTAHFSIRKYKTTGGNEVILKEADLKEHTQVHALKYFNNKLHAAVVYRQENPNNWMDNTYHMHIITKN
ncbi:hypothetical protein [Sphingobacterium humi]|uniref:Uncharacterized protein n=1 Tax=Sphingobacterium humi TaxID=1796905 RepID=A0A6N8KUJ8_9SPHI|nr:hypothetical protein [Sphingobacterium humi]MVZ60454.1 hypothetical protein [Sphingobacterium humi]